MSRTNTATARAGLPSRDRALVSALALIAALAAVSGAAFGQTAPEAKPATASDAGSAAPAAKPAEAAPTAEAAPAGAAPAKSAAELQNAEGKAVGAVTIGDTASGKLLVHVKVEGLPPGSHGMHVHEKGECAGPTFESAGGHFTAGKGHGVLHAAGPHGGDLPNILVPDSGSFEGEYFIDATLAGVVDADGAALIVHEKPDDYQSQPSGEAGARLVCGVFGAPA